MYKEVSRCRICGNTELVEILNLGNQALTGVFPARIDDKIVSGPLALVKCADSHRQDTCGLVQLRHSYDSHELYGNNYGYRSGLNQSMVDHLQRKVAAIKGLIQIQPGDLALDIGSNDGTLLRAMQEPGLDLVGMDPSGLKFKKYYPENVALIGDFFSADNFRHEFGTRKAKVVTSIAMFYDLENPIHFMEDVSQVLADDGIWVLEQSYLPTMLQMNAYDTVCHEHLEYYALKQIHWMCERVGLRILQVDFNDINGGSFSVVVVKANSTYPDNSSNLRELLEHENRCALDSLKTYQNFSDSVFHHRDSLRATLEELKAEGQHILGYGASTKGNVILQFCGITPELLPAIAEVNADKFGCYTPQTLIPIISEAEARRSNPDVFLVFPWHFRNNIVRRETEFLQAGGRLLFPLPAIELTARANSAAHRA